MINDLVGRGYDLFSNAFKPQNNASATTATNSEPSKTVDVENTDCLDVENTTTNTVGNKDTSGNMNVENATDDMNVENESDDNKDSTDETSKTEETKFYQPLPLDASMGEHLNALRADALHTADLNATKAYQAMEQVRKKVDICTDVLQKITELSDKATGTLDISNDPSLQANFAMLRSFGINIPNDKTNFTKDERDDIIKMIETKEKRLDTDLKLAMEKVSSSIKERNDWYQELKSLQDKYDNAIHNILSNMKKQS